MELVLTHTSETSRPLPQTLRPLSSGEDEASRKHLRILSAHRVLASLSDHNREQFRQVVETLREELDSDG